MLGEAKCIHVCASAFNSLSPRPLIEKQVESVSPMRHRILGSNAHLHAELSVVQGSLQLQEAPFEQPQLRRQLFCLVLRMSLALQQQILIVHGQLRQGHHFLFYFHQHVLEREDKGRVLTPCGLLETVSKHSPSIAITQTGVCSLFNFKEWGRHLWGGNYLYFLPLNKN